MEHARGHQRQGMSAAGIKRKISTPLRRTPSRKPSQGGTRALEKTRQQNATKAFTGRGFQPHPHETDDESAETEPVAASPRRVKPASKVRQSPRKLQAATYKETKTSKENVLRKVGRRTGAAAFEGKNIRLLEDGTENFNDYWTDSEAEVSSSQESVLKEKNFTFSKPSNLVPQTRSPKKVEEQVRYSTAPKIGRRTGVSAFEGKKIRLLKDGTENFDDFFTDDSTSKDSYLSEPSFKKSSVCLDESPAIIGDEDTDRVMLHQKVEEQVRYSTAPKIGRRTGVSAFEGKKIRLLKDGTENFDDYFTDDSTSKDSYLSEPSLKKSSVCRDESSAITGDEDSDRVMLHKSCNTSVLTGPPSSSNSKQLRKDSALKEKSVQDYEANNSKISPRTNLLASFMKTDLHANKATKDFNHHHENKAHSVGASDPEDPLFGGSPLKNQSLSISTRSRSKVTENPENNVVSHRKLEKSFASLRKISQNKGSLSHKKSSVCLDESSAITDDEDSDRSMLHKSCNTRAPDEPTSSNNSKQLREDSVHKEKSDQNYKASSASKISPRTNLLASFMETDPSANKATKDFSHCHENEAHSVGASDPEDPPFGGSPLKNQSLSISTRSRSKVAENPENHVVSHRKLEKSFASLHKISQNKGTSSSSSKHQNLLVAYSDSTQDNEGPSSNMSSNASRINKNVIISDNKGQPTLASIKVTETGSSGISSPRNPSRKSNGESKNKTKSFKEPQNSLPGITKSRLTKTFSHTQNSISFASSRNKNLWIEDSLSDEDSDTVNKSQFNKILSKRKVLDSEDSDEADASRLVPAPKVKKTKKGHDEGLQQSVGEYSRPLEYEVENNAEEFASVEPAPKVKKSKKGHDEGLQRSVSRPLEYEVENNDEEIASVESAPKVKKSKKKKYDDVLSTEGVRCSTRRRILPLENWRGQRVVYKYKSGEGFVYGGISPGRKEDDGAKLAIVKNEQKRKELEIKEKKRKTSKCIPKTPVFDAYKQKEVKVNLHRPFDFVEWTAVTIAGGGAKVPYFLTKTFASDIVTFGFLEISPMEKKASQYSPEDNLHFLVVRGRLTVVIRKNDFVFERLDSFIVPCTEAYSIENTGKSKALLSFCTFKTPFFPYQMSDDEEEENGS